VLVDNDLLFQLRQSRLRDCRNHHFISTIPHPHMFRLPPFSSVCQVFNPFHSEGYLVWIFRFANYKGRLIHTLLCTTGHHYSSIWSTCLDRMASLIFMDAVSGEYACSSSPGQRFSGQRNRCQFPLLPCFYTSSA